MRAMPNDMIQIDQDVFETGCDTVDVTSRHRPDTSWRFVDGQGHEHRWYVNGQPATAYVPSSKHETPTLVWVKTGEEYWEGDDEPHDVGHLECRQCGERVQPGYAADTNRQMVAGLRWCRINGVNVSPEEFEQRFKVAHANNFK